MGTAATAGAKVELRAKGGPSRDTLTAEKGGGGGVQWGLVEPFRSNEVTDADNELRSVS